MTETHRVKYNGETIEVWQEPKTQRWQSMIAASGTNGIHGIGPGGDFDSPEAAVDAAMEMVDEELEASPF